MALSGSMHIARFLPAITILFISIGSCSDAHVATRPDPDVDAPVKRFLAFYFHSYKRGIPDNSQLPELATIVTPDLLHLFDAAIKGEECYARQFNNEGAPLVEGDLFSSLVEGATSATYRPIVTEKDKATVEIEWTNDGKGISHPPKPFVWKDQVFLVMTASGWLISDFAHLGTWDFMSKGTVSETLSDVSKECAE